MLSILVPSEAEVAAKEVCNALEATDTHILYADCNAVSPVTAKRLDRMLRSFNSKFLDASIIGPPPSQPGTTRFYVSGESAESFSILSRYGLKVRIVGPHIGQASSLKMAYAAMSKGSAVLAIALLLAARRMGLCDALVEEFKISLGERYDWMESSMPSIPPKAGRWVGEMEEISRTFQDLNLTGLFHFGAADVYHLVAESALAWEKHPRLGTGVGLCPR